MMTSIQLYFTHALLLLALSCPEWQVSLSLPVTTAGQTTDSCVVQASTLLENITDALTKIKMFRGINCAQQSLELNTETNTSSVCAPKESTCNGLTKAEFDQRACLENIQRDLHYYYKFLAAQPDPHHSLHPTVSCLSEFMESCFTSPPRKPAPNEAAEDDSSTFDERLSLCKVLRGFQVRTITINRAIGYMNSGEHTK